MEFDNARLTTVMKEATAAREVLAAYAEQTERGQRPAPESLAAVRDAGFFGLSVPRSAGGIEADTRTAVAVLQELGRGCASTAWIAGLNLGAKRLLLETMPQATRDILLAEPSAIVAGTGAARDVATRSTPDGLIITGRWQFASGCEDAGYANLIVPTDGNFVSVLVSTRELTVEHTWQVAGMTGTGSHTLVAKEILVPAGRLQTGERFVARPATQTGGVAAMLAPLVGATRGAWDDTRAVLAGDKRTYGSSYDRIAHSPMARHWFATATQFVDMAEWHLRHVAEAVDAGEAESVADRTRLRTHLTTSAQLCRKTVEKLLDLGGLTSFAQSNTLQRRWRDIAVGTRHPQFNPYLAVEDYGRVLLGVGEPMSTLL